MRRTERLAIHSDCRTVPTRRSMPQHRNDTLQHGTTCCNALGRHGRDDELRQRDHDFDGLDLVRPAGRYSQ